MGTSATLGQPEVRDWCGSHLGHRRGDRAQPDAAQTETVEGPATAEESPKTDATPEPLAAPTATAEQGSASAEGSPVIAGDGYELTVPAGGWVVGEQRVENGGRLLRRMLTGPEGVIVIVHTPGDPARPNPDLVVSSQPVQTGAAEASRETVEGFPTPECRDRLCDDFVLNDPVFGGLAILADDAGSSSAATAGQEMALSVVALP